VIFGHRHRGDAVPPATEYLAELKRREQRAAPARPFVI